MRNVDIENQISCLVEYGVIYSKRDMIRILRDLDRVEYFDLVDNAEITRGEGYIVEVYANNFDASIVFNHRLHINVNGFDLLKIKTNPDKIIELISGHRTIKLRPLTNILHTNKNEIEEEIDEQRIAIASQLACDNELDIDNENI